MRRRNKIVAIVVLVGAILYPIRYTAAPSWEVWVVDETGKPLEGMNVRLSYQNYSAESKGHELDAITGPDGRVYFPLQRASASIARYLVYSVWSATTGVHASFGRHASVFIFGNGRDGSATTDGVITDWSGAPPEMKSRIVARQLPKLER
jgi:hypothetical protein